MGVTALRRHNAELLQEEGRNTGPDKNSVEIPDSFKLQVLRKWVKSKRMGAAVVKDAKS